MSMRSVSSRLNELESRLSARQIRTTSDEDPLLSWKPTYKQSLFIDSILQKKTRTALLVGGNRSGKSQSGAYIASYLARFGWPGDNKPTYGWVCGLDYPMLRDTLMPKIFDNGFTTAGQKPFIPQSEILEWRAGDQILKLRNGSMIGFKSCASGREKFQGAEKHWVLFDEEPPESIYHETTIRTGSEPLYLMIAATLLPPEGQAGGVSWIYEHFLEPFKSGDNSRCLAFGASIYDNPYIDVTEIARLENVFPPHTTQGRIRLLGEWIPGASGCRAYPNFERSLNVMECRHLLSPMRPLIWFWDFNVSPLVSGVAQEIDGITYVMQEFALPEGNISEMVAKFRAHYPEHHAEVWVYGDATGRSRTSQTAKSNYTLIANEMMNYPVPMRLKVPETNPAVTSRINSMQNALRSPSGMAGIMVDPSCKELIADLEQVLLDDDWKIKKVSNQKDSYSKRTHISDALGYYISYEKPMKALAIRVQPMVSRRPVY